MTMMEITPLAASAVFSCGVFYALADFTRKKASAFCAPELLIALVFSSIAPLYWVLTAILGDWTFSSGYILPGLGNVLANVLANILFIRAVSVSPLSKTIPLLSLTPVLTALLGALFLGETLFLRQWAGILLVVLGILFLYAPEKRLFDLLRVWKNLAAEKGAKYMGGVALFWTIAPVLDRIALRYTTVALDGAIHFTIGAALLWLWIILHGSFRMPEKSGWKTIGILSLLYAFAMGTQMLSLKLVYVGVLESVKRVMAQISALALGRFAFAEEITANKVLAITLMCLGVPLIVL